MKTLKQLQVEHVANILLTAMEKQAACLELLCDEIADGKIPFCKGRKLLKSITGKCWSTMINDMTLIDATLNADKPTAKDLNMLKWMCKNK